MILRIFIIHLFCFVSILALCQESKGVDARLEAAYSAYEKEDFTNALEIYKELVAEGFQSCELYYNLGNSYFREKKIPEAILSYERALMLKPADKDVVHNLEIARNSIDDRILPAADFFLKRWMIGMQNLLSMEAWAILSLFLFWSIVAIFGYQFWRGRPLFRYAQTAMILLGILLILSLAFAYSTKRKKEGRQEAIVMVNSTLYEAPSGKSEARSRISAGEKVRILDSLEMLLKVELPNTDQGWVDAMYVERI